MKIKTQKEWKIYLVEYEAKEVMYKANWGSGSHLKIDKTMESIIELVLLG